MDFLREVYNWTLNKSFPHKGVDGFKANSVTSYEDFLKTFDNDYLKRYRDMKFLEKYSIVFLTSEEERNNISREYFIFKDIFVNNYIYELMALDTILTGHNTLEHVIGVNHLSMHIGRQLFKLGLPIDLGILVGASLGHDIGKYGVLEADNHKVPYYHYYYTEEWFERFNMREIGHIATNHSTWDLELETLPIESLVLIYSDFRVKNKVDKGEYNMHIFPLSESFNIILDKLDNVDEKKENRYKKVYKKLKDFEDYIVSLGVDISLEGHLSETRKKPYELMNKDEITQNIKYLAIEHNINLMSKLTDNVSFNSMIEMARGESDWRKLRLYINIFREYSTYLTQEQKMTTLHFLSELLLSAEEDIRKEAAELIGILIAVYDEEYRKELPPSVEKHPSSLESTDILDDFMEKLLYPDHKIADSQVEWLYNLKNIIKSLFETSHKSNHGRYFDVICNYYDNFLSLPKIAQFYLSQTINYLPFTHLNNDRLVRLITYTMKQLDSIDIETRLSTLDIIHEMLYKTNNIILIASMRNWLIANINKAGTPAENYLKYILGRKINISPKYQRILDQNYKEEESNITEIFLENLKTATEWVKKKINIDILYDQVIKNPIHRGLHTSMHLCNILKVSAVERVRNYSGITLLNIFHLLSLEERNDVAVELLRALEMESYQFSKYIPDYLGRLLLYLPPTEFDEIIDDFEDKIKVSSTQVVFLLLSTIGICIEHYSIFKDNFKEADSIHHRRIERLLGLLTLSMASYDNDVKSESIRIISNLLFRSQNMDLGEKYNIFKRVHKKTLVLLDSLGEDNYLFYNNASSLNAIYRFISDYEFYHDNIKAESLDNVAFFPGSFDPFSLSHKEIAIEIRDLGFQVYLAVDEFSWSKRTEPHSFRRNIINMSIGNEKDIYIFPKDIPINISNPKDLNTLKNSFPDQKVYIVVGTDVVINASAYKKEGPILDFPHIIFDRKVGPYEEGDDSKLEESINRISGEVIRLSLPPRYEDISSSLIRENIDINRDISRLIDPLAQSYIYDYGLYLREPQYKSLFNSKTIDVEVKRDLDLATFEELRKEFGHELNVGFLQELINKPSYRILMVREWKTNKLLGFSVFYWVRQHELFDEFKDMEITNYIRQNAHGRLVLFAGLSVQNNDGKLIEIVLNESLALAVTRDYNYALYNNSLTQGRNLLIEKHLKLQGFQSTNYHSNKNPILLVDMNNPMTLNLDLENILKPPYSTNRKVLETIDITRNSLKASISNLYPGELLLTFNRDMTYSKLIQKICDLNEVSIEQSRENSLGANMCVPFGSILNSSIIPNTVTKTMHTEKIFKANIKDFNIGSYPFYLSLEEQARVLKSFDRPVILVDDLLQKGYRINVIEPILRRAGIEIRKIIVGILSGRGSETGKVRDLELDSAYYIPNLKLWFNESSQYPFIGGDMVDKESLYSSLIPSVNMILPYVAPSFIKNTKHQAIYNLSETCLMNSRIIFKVIEEVYQSINQKNLNIRNLGEVLISPRYPDINKGVVLERNMKPSKAIEMDMEYLKRIEDIIRRQKE